MTSWTLVTVLLAVSVGLSAGLTQSTLDYIAENLQIEYNVINNIDNTPNYKAQFVFHNGGSVAITGDSWELYFCNIRMMEPDSLRDPNPNGVELGTSGLRAYHINGCLFKLVPDPDFGGIEAQGTLMVEFLASDWVVAKTDIMPNWYIAAQGLNAKNILSTVGEDIDYAGPFDTPEKWKRHKTDVYNPPTAEDRYEEYNGANDMKEPPLRIVPKPKKVSGWNGGHVNIGTGDWVVYSADSEIQSEANFLAESLGLTTSTQRPTTTRYIEMKLNSQLSLDTPCNNAEEGYKVTVDSSMNLVILEAYNPVGIFYAQQTLQNFLDGSTVPHMTVEDCPRFPYRGLELDVGRNFFDKDYILHLITAMAAYKLNVLHLHLTDDEGWRLEIPGLPELTGVGATRCHDLDATTCIMPQLGSGAGVANSGTGFYTVSEYQEILAHAQKHHIEVIPEFDVPGHSHAAIIAMEARGEAQYLLSDPNDVSEYFSVQMFRDNAVNPCIESTYTFMEKVVVEVQKMHKGIQDLRVFHYGGDEVPYTAWRGSPECQAYNMSNVELKKYFVERVANITHTYGLNLGAWEDGVMADGSSNTPFDRTLLRNDEVYVHAWSNIWEWGGGSRAYKLANANYKSVIAHATHFYFDHPSEPDPEERGYYWAPRFTNTEKTFSYIATDVYENIEIDRMGNPLTREDICKNNACDPLEEDKVQNIVGIQGELWTETVRTAEQSDEMLFPRLLAMAERAWHQADWESESNKDNRESMRQADWNEFANVVGYRELPRLDRLGVTYHIRPPGGMSAGNIEARGEFPGMPVKMSTDGGTTWADVGASLRIADGATVTLAARSTDERRSSRTTSVVYNDVN